MSSEREMLIALLGMPIPGFLEVSAESPSCGFGVVRVGLVPA
jgi:hypothetical protein